jgi:uncharacterized protein YigE (DUF2233 family)
LKHKILFLILVFSLVSGLVAFNFINQAENEQILSYIVDPRNQNLQLYWKDDTGQILKSIENLKEHIESKHQTLIFAMNAGMYNKDNSPKGLFIQDYKKITPLDTLSGTGNFYLKPNGVFYITADNKPTICTTQDFKFSRKIKLATQSGPMLVIDGAIHPQFTNGSSNINIRNGVGILPNGNVVFAMSKQKINFYDFAMFFKNLGCKNALYLDGLVSRTYLPEKSWIQLDGDFGVMIGVTVP